MNEQTKLKTGSSDRPAYVTRRGRLLWYDAEGRYSFCEFSGVRVLVTAEGKFHCFDNDKRVKRIIYNEGEEERWLR